MNTSTQTADDLLAQAQIKTGRTHLFHITENGVIGRWTFWVWLVFGALFFITGFLSILGSVILGALFARMYVQKKAWRKQKDYYQQLVAARVAAKHFDHARA